MIVDLHLFRGIKGTLCTEGVRIVWSNKFFASHVTLIARQQSRAKITEKDSKPKYAYFLVNVIPYFYHHPSGLYVEL